MINSYNKTLHVSDSSSVNHQQFFAVHTALLYVIQVCWQQDQDGTPSWSCSQAANKHVWHIPLLCMQWKTHDYGQMNCPKHVEFYFKIKFEKLVQLFGFIVRIHHDARSPGRQFITMHGHLNINLSRCTVTWTSIYHDARSPERQKTPQLPPSAFRWISVRNYAIHEQCKILKLNTKINIQRSQHGN